MPREIRAQKKPHAPAGGLAEFKLHQALGGVVVVRLQPIFVAHHLAVELIDQFVDRSVQVGMRAFSKQLDALDVNIAFGLLPTFFLLEVLQRQQYFDIDHLIEVPFDAIQFGCEKSLG